MAVIDIRDEDGEEIDTILFGPEEKLLASVDESSDVFYINSNSKSVPVYFESIDNLIMALEKARELWE